MAISPGFEGVVFPQQSPQEFQLSITNQLQHQLSQAAEAAAPAMAVAEGNATMAEAVRAAREAAEAEGIRVRAFGRVVLDDGSAGWATVLAELLVTAPSKAKLQNATLAALLTKRMGMSKDFDPKRFSKPLPRSASDEAQAILAAHGYTMPVRTGSDIKRAVLAGKEAKGRVQFTATGISIDGTMHTYKARERTPTGLPHNDLSIRVAGADVPLTVALALLGVGIGEFMAGDAAAVARATPEELAKRAAVLRPAKVARSIKELQQAVRDTAEKQHAMTMDAWAAMRNARPWLPEFSTLADTFQPGHA